MLTFREGAFELRAYEPLNAREAWHLRRSVDLWRWVVRCASVHTVPAVLELHARDVDDAVGVDVFA